MKKLTVKYTHIIAAIYNLAFVYTPLHNWQHGFAVVKFVSMPLLIATGFAFAIFRKKHVSNKI